MTGKGICVRAAAAALALGLAAGAAQGAVYVGEWDPPFNRASTPFGDAGAWFERMGWRGVVEVDVSDACGTSGTVVVGGLCTAQVTALTVDMYQYDLGDPGGLGGPTLATVNFTGLGSVAVNRVRFVGGVLAEIDSGVFGANNATIVVDLESLPESVDPGFAIEYDWYLRFIIDLDVDDYNPFELFFPEEEGPGERGSTAGPVATTMSDPILYSGPILGYNAFGEAFGFSNLQEFRPDLSFTPRDPGTVPLPGTLLLGLAALGALGATSRRG